ncbi:MAG: radical SAM protein [Actinomycetia bacterium]|nr:radical SAM protein [Actinomycetes bacterium]
MTGRPPRHWFDLSPDERVRVLADAGQPAWRAAQIGAHLFGRGESDPGTWSDVPTAVKDLLTDRWLPDLLTPVREFTTDAGRTVKTVWRTADGNLIESVLMRYPRRNTLCVSSQAGCGMGCPFCATGQGGLVRNLSAGEITWQVAAAQTALAEGRLGGGPGHLNNIVFMGMGEPLANYGAVLAAIRGLVRPAPDGFGHAARGITVSTVGLVPQIRRLAAEGLPLTLAVSLHAPEDALRDRLVPMNARFGVDAVLDAAWDYARVTKRRVSVEYALMRDLNDAPALADELGRRLRARGDWAWAHVNLIPLNPTPGSEWTASRPEVMDAFEARLVHVGVPVTRRDTRGRDIDGACGQLAARAAGGDGEGPAARVAPNRP